MFFTFRQQFTSTRRIWKQLITYWTDTVHPQKILSEHEIISSEWMLAPLTMDMFPRRVAPTVILLNII